MNKETYNFRADFPEFEGLIHSKQFEYAQELIKKRLDLGLSFNEIAEIAGYTPEEYIALEYGDQGIKLAEFKRVINQIDTYIHNNQ